MKTKGEQAIDDHNNLISLYTKLAKVKKDLGSVTKSSVNPFFKSSYADLNAHLNVVEPVLEKHGLILTQPTFTNGAENIVKSDITDVETGAMISSSLKLVFENEDMQKLGGAITYARRYTLGSLLAMKAEDDDGNTAAGKPKKFSKVKAASEDF